MVKFVSGALVAASLALGSIASAQPAAPAVTDAEFKCMASVNKAASKFVGSKAKCVMKCLSNFWKGIGPESDCLPPYGGTTLTCIADPLKGAEAKYVAAIRKACDPSFKPGTDCPECYSGDCSDSGYATARMQQNEGEVDSFVPGVGCERAGAEKAEQACQLNTAKTLVKLVGSVNKCYDKCYANARKGTVSFASCAPPASDPATSTCVSTAEGKSAAGIDKKCSQVVPNANPDCPGPDQYPSGAMWTNLVQIVISGNIPQNYCNSPSGAFVD